VTRGPALTADAPLAALLRARGISAAELAAALGLRPDTLRARLRRGTVRAGTWTAEELSRAAEVLGLDAEQATLLAGSPPLPPQLPPEVRVRQPGESLRHWHGRLVARGAARSLLVDTPCDLWLGPVDGQGCYLVLEGERVDAALLGWAIEHGPASDDLDHLCGQDRCINPEHLSVAR